MRSLNLDKNFQPCDAPSIPYESFVFSGGEPHIKIGDFEDTEIVITTRITSFNDIGVLCMAVDALCRENTIDWLGLFIGYFPGGRQDRVNVGGEPLTVKVYADIINSLDFDTVYVFDPHSDVTPALIDNCVVTSNHDYVEDVLRGLTGYVLISPDSGSSKKIHGLAKHLQCEVVQCDKIRDTRTGALSGFQVYADDLQGMDCVIVDDICDGGGTFAGLATELKNKNAGDLYLIVSHGIFSKGYGVLSDFKEVFTTNSFKDIPKTQDFHYIRQNFGKHLVPTNVTQYNLTYGLD